MKASLMILCAAGTVLMTSCTQTTLENRRDMYFPQKVNGPYTRMVSDGIPNPQAVDTEQAAEEKTN